MTRLLYQAMALMGAGSVKTTWKYSTGSRSAWRASSQRCAALAWHFGQWRSRQVTECTLLRALWEVLPYGEKMSRSEHGADSAPV